MSSTVQYSYRYIPVVEFWPVYSFGLIICFQIQNPTPLYRLFFFHIICKPVYVHYD